VTEIWYEYVGLDGKIIGLHQFGLSAPGPEVMKERGIDAQHVIDAAKSLR
jgi:transketolase